MLRTWGGGRGQKNGQMGLRPRVCVLRKFQDLSGSKPLVNGCSLLLYTMVRNRVHSFPVSRRSTVIRSLAICALLFVVFPSTADARWRLFSRPTAVVKTTVKSYGGSLQAQAEMEARMMASRQFKGHVRGTVAGVRFSGVGFSSSTPRAPTCTPGRGMTLVADAVARGRDGWYRVRYWR